MLSFTVSFFFLFFNATATSEIYTLSLHDALPIARDIVQDAYIKLINALEQGTEIQNEKSWLYRVCHNSALDYYRKNKRRQEKRGDIQIGRAHV